VSLLVKKPPSIPTTTPSAIADIPHKEPTRACFSPIKHLPCIAISYCTILYFWFSQAVDATRRRHGKRGRVPRHRH
jgi:hypothetical protein